MATHSYDWDLDEDALLSGLKALDIERRMPNFGNVGSVNNLLSKASERMELRVKGLPPAERARQQPTPYDLCPPRKEDNNAADIFSDLIGCMWVVV